METLIILSEILLPIKSLVVSTVFWIALFEAVFIASVVYFLALYVNGLKFWVQVFKRRKFVGAISNKLPNSLFGTNVYKTLESCW